MILDRAQRQRELDGFDIELIGFDCEAELDCNAPRTCPWNPGCGLLVSECPLKRRLAQICRMPQRVQ